jgi:D-glycero-alpha-D-manno-heptose 1-phosphate guanylyltransferase
VTSAIILAGGLGTRLRQAVPDLPKPMAPLDGRPFLEYQMDYWIGQGVRRFVLSVGYRHELIEKHFGASYRGAEVAYAVEAAPLGTGGGLLLAMDKMRASGPWLVLNGDTFFDVSLAELRKFHEAKQAEITLSLFPVENNTRYTGVEIDSAQRITRLKSTSDGSRQLINGGVYLLAETALSGLPYRRGDKASFESDILERALEAGKRLYGYSSNGKFIDIGVPEDYSRAAHLLSGEKT